MDLFGLKAHDERHDEVERQVRRLIEQVAQLTINLGVTRTQLRKLALEVEGKIDAADVDPVILAVNERIKETRVRLAAASEAAEENWIALNAQLADALDDLNESLAEDEAAPSG
jgi:hypothetical protein